MLSPSATREATCIYLFNTNNQALLHLWWKENLVKHQKFSKYYDLGWNFRLWKLCLVENLMTKFPDPPNKYTALLSAVQ